MRVLVVGGGAREHAILWKLAQSPRRPRLFAAPGNAGTAALAENLPVAADDVDALAVAARDYAIDLTIVGPETPLVLGIADRFRAEGLRLFGPTAAAARIEGSKSFAKQLMRDAGVPTAPFAVFDDPAEARAYVRSRAAPIVVKADGLAAGKGVVVAQTQDEALAAVNAAMTDGAFGEAGRRVVIEDCLTGREVSVFCFTDGAHATPLAAACDYKRVFDGDRGPNTGGMGGYSPPPWWDAALERRIRETCIEPVIRQLARQGAPYVGALYGGLMLTADGPAVIEFNARLGDPEAELILPRLETDLLDVVDAALDGGLPSLDLRWSADYAVGVVLASGGYPGPYETGFPIAGLREATESALVFHAGTAAREGAVRQPANHEAAARQPAESVGAVVSAGGRVLTLVGCAPTMDGARAKAYAAANAADFSGKQFRSDIAAFAAGRRRWPQ